MDVATSDIIMYTWPIRNVAYSCHFLFSAVFRIEVLSAGSVITTILKLAINCDRVFDFGMEILMSKNG